MVSSKSKKLTYIQAIIDQSDGQASWLERLYKVFRLWPVSDRATLGTVRDRPERPPSSFRKGNVYECRLTGSIRCGKGYPRG